MALLYHCGTLAPLWHFGNFHVPLWESQGYMLLFLLLFSEPNLHSVVKSATSFHGLHTL